MRHRAVKFPPRPPTPWPATPWSTSSAPGPWPATSTHRRRATPLAILGGPQLWLLRLALAPASTLAGFRAWVPADCPVPPAADGPPRRTRGRRPRRPDSWIWSPNG